MRWHNLKFNEEIKPLNEASTFELKTVLIDSVKLIQTGEDGSLESLQDFIEQVKIELLIREKGFR